MPALKKDNVYDRIARFYEDERDKLSEEDAKVEKRVIAAWSIILNDFLSDHQAIKRISRAFNISAMTARKDVEAAYSLFGNAVTTNKAAKKKILEHKANHLFQVAGQTKPARLASYGKGYWFTNQNHRH